MYFQSLLFSHTREAVKKISEWSERDKIKNFLVRNDLFNLLPTVSLLRKDSFKDSSWNEHLDTVRNRVFHYTKYKNREEIERIMTYISKNEPDQFMTISQDTEGCKLKTSIGAYIICGILVEEMDSLDDFTVFVKKIIPYSTEILSFTEHGIRSYMLEKGISSCSRLITKIEEVLLFMKKVPR